MGVYQYKDGKLNSIAGAENAAQVYYDNTGTTSSATNVQDALTELNTNCHLKQNKTDSTLGTTSKTVVGAINELNNDLSVFSFRNNGGTAQYSMNDGSTWTNFKNPVGTKYIYSNGTYDVTNYASASVSVSTSLSETTLWSNSSPSSSFTQQTVTLNQSITNFTYIKIVADTTTSEGTDTVSMMKVSEFLNTAETGKNIARGALAATGKSGDLFLRSFWYVSSTQVGIGRGITGASGVINNAAVIPVYVLGLK